MAWQAATKGSVQNDSGSLEFRRCRFLCATRGRRWRLRGVRGDEDLKHHLANIGFVEGSQVHVVSASASNIIVVVKGARFGLDAKVAQHVMTA